MHSDLTGLSYELQKKYQELLYYIKSLNSVVVAFSSGVDSAFLLYAAREALDNHLVAVTATSDFFPNREHTEAVEFCEQLGVKHILAPINLDDIDHFSENPKDRCYHCKKHLFLNMLAIASSEGFEAVIEGSNVDDLGDYRPGLTALKELDIKSPLREAGLTKKDIRNLSHCFKLPTWDKPSFACLASRIPYGEVINREKLDMVEKAEDLLLSLSFKQFRVRLHAGNVARIELLPEDFSKLLEESTRAKVYDSFKEYGFSYVSMDIKGYRTGSLNETL